MARHLLTVVVIAGFIAILTCSNQPESSVEDVDMVLLDSAIAYLGIGAAEDGMEQVVVMRHGKVIYEGTKIDSVHNVWSCSKTFTSLVMGLLVDEGKCSPSTLAKEYYPELENDPLYSRITLHHLLTLTSGYEGTKDLATKIEYPFTMKPALHAPGEMFFYSNYGMDVTSRILTKIAGESLYCYFKRKIADPIGMDESKWHWGVWDTIDGIEINGGSGKGERGVYICASELAKVGQLILNNGSWQGTQIIPREYLALATKNQVSRDLDAYMGGWFSSDDMGSVLMGAYGYNFWVNDTIIAADTLRIKWPNAPKGTVLIQGNNFNNCFIIPEWDIVFVRCGNDSEIDFYLYDGFFKRLGEALIR